MKLRWRSGPLGASWIAIDTALAEIVQEAGAGISVEVTPGGGRENIEVLRRGDCDIATSTGFLAVAAHRGLTPYGPLPFDGLRTLALGWNEIPFHLIRASDAPDHEFAEALRSASVRIGIPPESTSDELTFRHLLRMSGASYQSVRSAGGTILHADYDTLARLFASGTIDWIFGATAAPAAVVEAIAKARDAELLPIDARIADQFAEIGYSRAVLPRDTYPDLQSCDIDTIAMSSAILTTDRLPRAMAQEILTRIGCDPERVRRIHPSLRHFEPSVAFACGLTEPPSWADVKG